MRARFLKSSGCPACTGRRRILSPPGKSPWPHATGTRIHIAHVSTEGSAALVRDAKARGVQVTCETCPHYFMLTEEELLRRDADYRMNPPLRTEADRKAMLAAAAGRHGGLHCHRPRPPRFGRKSRLFKSAQRRGGAGDLPCRQPDFPCTIPDLSPCPGWWSS